METSARPPDARRQDTTVGSGIDFSDPNSKLAPFYLRTTSVLFTGALAFLLALYSQQPLHHTDVWAHLKHGNYIVETGLLSGPEPFSPYTDPAVKRPAFYWLTQVTYHAIFQTGARLAGGDEAQRLAGGAELLRQGHVVAIVAVFAFFWFAYRRATGSGSLALLGLVLVCVGAFATIGIHRPQLFALVWFAALYAILAKPEVKWRVLIFIPLLFVLWVNTHGSYPVGLLLLSMIILGRAWEMGMRNAVRNRDLQRLVLAGLLGAASLSFLNPEGPRTWLVTWKFAEHPNLRSMLEWQPLNFAETTGGHWFYWGSVLLLIAVQSLSPRGFTLTEVLLTLTFGIAPLVQERFMAWWLPVCVGIVLNHLNEWATAKGWVWKPSLPSLRKTLLASALLGFGIMLTPLATWAQGDRPGDATAILHPATPYGLAETLRGNRIDDYRYSQLSAALDSTFAGKPLGPIYCSEALGEFLYWRGFNEVQPMLFTHAHLFPPEYWDACLQVKTARPGWWEFLERHGVNIIVIEALQPNFQPLPLVLEIEKQDGWKIVIDERERKEIRDPKARIFVAMRKVPIQR